MNNTPQFPKTIFADQKTPLEQMKHMIEEGEELSKALRKHMEAILSKDQKQINQTFRAMIDEATDMGHAYKTLCDITPEVMAKAAVRVISKNSNRGYYDVPGAMSKPSNCELEAEIRRNHEAREVPSPQEWWEAQPELPGGSTPSQYAIPEGAKDLQDLIEHRGMNFSLGNIFKACFRMGQCQHSDKLRDARKILWFAQREVERLEKEQ